MGCDIHGIVEIKIGDKWVGIKELKANGRNYERFAQLASVRGDSSRKPQGIPLDASDMSMYYIEQWGEDGHSHSYMPLTEAAEIFKYTDKPFIEDHVDKGFRVKFPFESYFGITTQEDEGCSYPSVYRLRLVFWFDN